MKRSERRLLEEKLRYAVMEEEVELDPNLRLQMLERAEAALMQPSESSSVKPSRGHGIGRRVLVVSAAAVLIMVLSFGFAVLTPESVGHAKGFFRTAAIWVNDTFHLGYEFEEPVENQVSSASENATYSTLEEATQNIPYPLVYLDDPNFELQSISVQGIIPFEKILLLYSDGTHICRILLTPLAEDILTDLNSDVANIIAWSNGELACWESSSQTYALTYYSGMEISIDSKDIPFDDFLALCQALKAVN